jgi:hypothetical protein
MNAHVRDNLKALLPLDALAWTGYTPSLTQSGTVTKTVTYAKYTQFGNSVKCRVLLSVTGGGTGSNAIIIGLPVTATLGSFSSAGAGYVFDSSAGLNYGGVVQLVSTTTAQLLPTATNGSGALGVVGFTAALASGDTIHFEFEYEV